jgi:hypothetical protein
LSAERDAFLSRGWARFPFDPDVAAWADAAAPLAAAIAADPRSHARDLRCGGTWFVGANALPNGPDGGGAGLPPLAGAPVAFIREALGLDGFAWDRAQLSVIHPGYPRRDPGESESAFAFRRGRDAAHVDGLLPDAARRRRMAETHLFILGLPLSDPAPGASPFVVWEGSHAAMRAAFRQAFEGLDPRDWSRADVTDRYHAARRRCFDTLPRVELVARPGEAYLVHRLALHGVAPWRAADAAAARAVAYFRPAPPPDAPGGWVLDWP